MSQTFLFGIGAVIFVAVSTAVFLYGQTIFRDWQDRDEDQARGSATGATGDVSPSTGPANP